VKTDSAATPRIAGTPGTNSLWQLDAVRGAAAAYIAAGHICRDQLDAVVPGLRFLLGFGQEVVIAFFLLSGFVIHWSVEHKPALRFGTYLRARAVRIYPLFILTLALTLFLARLHDSTDPRTGWPTLLGNLLMLQDWGAIKPGVWVEVYGGVLVLWSLSYEWWFYMLYFPLSRKIPRDRQILVVAVITVSQALVYLWYPNQASRFLLYFSIWWTGVELARAKLAGLPLTLATLAGPIAIVTAIAGLLGFEVWREQANGVILQAGVHPVLELRHFMAALILTGGALLWHRLHWAGFRPLLGGFARLAPSAYAVYLLHEPLVLHAGLMNFVANPLLRVLFDAVMVLTAAWLAEKYIQGWCRRVFLG
jgi:peptidoglycan/LPS O-acetylase OafA/YrhL